MVKRKSAVIACVLVFFVAAACTAMVAIPGTVFFLNIYQKRSPVAVEDGAQDLDYDLLAEISSYVQSYSIWAGDADILTRNAAQGIAYADNDVYAQYYTPEDYAELQQQQEGNYVGIGVSVSTDTTDGLVVVRDVYDDSPAAQAGIQVGDKILSVDAVDVTVLTMDELVDLVRGEAGTQVTLGLLRGADEVSVTVTRNEVIQHRTLWAMKDDGIGYIRITEFNGNAYTLFVQAVQELTAQNARGIILDLRNNPGGMQDIVVPIADILLPKGPVLSLVDRDGNLVDEDTSDSNYWGIPLVVLVNEYTASAAELLSGSIQDYEMGTIVGVTTYGKGVAQSFYPLSNGGVLKITATKYLTGGGHCPQDVGITPDIEVELPDEVYEDYTNRFCNPDYDAQYAAALGELARLIDAAPAA
ncbi:MAG: S41 family peptidase [Eubacteriales bacterium]|nr:S41 family peptidase [Eubacteriales bacterium]